MSAVTDAARDVVSDPWQIYYRPRRAFGLLLSDPAEFFERRADEKGMRWEGTLIAIYAIVAAGAMFMTIQFIMEAFPYGVHTLSDSFAGRSDETVPFRLVQLMYGTAVRFGIGLVLIWVGYSAAFRVLGWLYNGRGSFMELLKVNAWAMLPIAVGSIIYTVGMAVTFWWIEVDSELVGTTSQEQLLFLLNQGRNEPWMIALEVLMIALAGVSFYFFRHAVSEAHELDLDRVQTLVLVPVALHILFLVNALLQHTVWAPEPA